MAILKKAVGALNSFIDSTVIPKVHPLVEKNAVPDALIRLGIRAMLRDLLAEFDARGIEGTMRNKQAFIAELKTLPIAIDTRAANDQHYMIPSEFYHLVLGPSFKYSCGYWPTPTTTFAESETLMLDLYCERAELEDGMRVLDLGCGWGSVSLHLAKKYPQMQITSVSNSASQRAFIEEECRKRGLTNVTVVTADINAFDVHEKGEEGEGGEGSTPSKKPASKIWKGKSSNNDSDALLYDRVISIEMFEHCKNYQLLLKKVASWLKPGGKLFVHIFTHATTAYHFDKGWMAENFFTGGQMPSQDLLLYFQDDLKIEEQWVVNGHHYSKTNAAWLANLDANQAKAKELLGAIYGTDKATKAYVDWRLFFLTLVECFAMDDGNQWGVSLYRFVK